MTLTSDLCQGRKEQERGRGREERRGRGIGGDGGCEEAMGGKDVEE